MLLFLFLVFSLSSYSQFIDDFSDGDFTSNPAWTGNLDKFVVNSDNRLQLNDDQASQSYLSSEQVESDLNNKEWRFFIKQSFSGSSNNFGRVYLSSTATDLSFSGNQGAATEGYFLLFGESGSEDAIRLYRNNSDLSVTEIGAGPLGFISSSFEITLKIVRDNTGNWSVYADANAGEDFSLQFTAFDDTFTTGGNLGIVCNYTVSNSDNFYFDNFYFGSEIVDNEPPEILSHEILSATALDLVFSEPLDLSTSQLTSNYDLSGIGAPIAATLDASDFTKVHLVFSTNFPENQALTLSVSNVVDLAGNTMSNQQITFTYFIPQLGNYRQVVFSEIMADPNPAVNLPEVEYVELKNTSNETFNLENWVFVNTNTEKTLASFILSPGNLVLLCDAADAELMQPYGDVLPIASFSALANTGDSLTLLNEEGTLIDVIKYSDSWYNNSELSGGGYSLVNTNYLSLCPWNEQIWKATTSADGGTPGQDNLEVSLPDNAAPLPTGVNLISTTEIAVSFDEILDESTLLTSNFSLSGGIDIIATAIDSIHANSVILSLDIPINYAENYVLTLNNISDCEGDAMQIPVDFEFLIGFSPEAGDLIINEIMADPDTDLPSPNAEYVELYNTTDKLIEMQGVIFEGSTITASYLLEPHQYVVLTDIENTGEFLEETPVIYLQNMVTLTNSGRELALLDHFENNIDQLHYTLEWYHDNSKANGGYSLERINDEDPCSDGQNWTASQSLTGATEGTINSVHDNSPDTQSPEALYALTWNANSIEVVFDEQISGFSLNTASVEVYSEQGDLLILPEDTTYYLSTASPTSIFVLFEEPFDTNFIWTIVIHGVEDCWGNPTDNQAVQFAAPSSFLSTDIIINEVLFNPRTNGEDYVELYNNSDNNINLTDWYLANVEDQEVANFKEITPIPRMLFAHQYIVLTKDKAGVLVNYPNAVEKNILVMESLPTFSSKEGTVVLVSSLEEVADSVVYSESMHFSLLEEVKGVSLERIDSNRSSTDRTNWHSAAEQDHFGTPGYLNSQHLISEADAQELQVYPEVFSPDNDGYQDVVTFSFTLEKPGFLANMIIYDKEARPIKSILQNQLMGIENSVSWDGTTDNHQLAPMGIYVVLLEYFDLQGKVSYQKNTCVLGHLLE